MAEIKQRSLEEVKGLGPEEAVEIMRQAGIVGAGGGGFPTYFKYMKPQPHLIVNATESEPGYWGDKLLHKEYLEEFLQVFDAMKTIFGFEQISLAVHEKDREWFAEYQDHASDGVYDVRYVPNTYALGEEKTLVKHSTESRVPRFVNNPDGTRRPGMPPDVGKVVNNTESLLNVYNALFLGKPLTTKFFTVYGEEVDTKVYEVPIGASVAEVLGIAGLDVENSGHLTVLDGGPYLHDMAIAELGKGDAYVRRMTNSLFVIPEDRRGKEYAEIETECPEEGIVSLVGKVSGVNLPLGGGLLKPATPLVSEGDEVEYEQKLGEPVDEGFSVGVWASMGGEISSIENDIIAISGGAIPQEEAGAEAEATMAGGSQPRGEAEPFQEAGSSS
ncbi:MAG: Respiratory-chain NADH dehydrogenase domain, 51 kDa subunit [uncultured Rubrobacteraceae bacterium]|uniref:Respiratory-chain NADH dehydrogenase domain, 51 kDa subunit n=1 Tax=uncultured Rubrobacteraceae bacterium TaxID=349277 RepID=A0A6J4QPF4_9ACTN|nr:MAG: Respiratory-chain NADH dehydrogenase domain, 51 kDa subunit [uncultured Rubrobacteraceae bacterium]